MFIYGCIYLSAFNTLKLGAAGRMTAVSGCVCVCVTSAGANGTIRESGRAFLVKHYATSRVPDEGTHKHAGCGGNGRCWS